MRQLLKGAKIYDGTGSDPYIGDILIEGDEIAMIASEISLPADSVINLAGKSVSSGFIDGHSHNDWFAIKKDPLPYFWPFIRQGITTFVTGNCGISVVGFEPGCGWMEHMGGGLFGFENTVGCYGTAKEYFNAMDRRMPCNMALLAGHCTARAAVGGTENRKLTPEEEEKMLAILEKALQQGAAGISLGMMYNPGLYADVEELKKGRRPVRPVQQAPDRASPGRIQGFHGLSPAAGQVPPPAGGGRTGGDRQGHESEAALLPCHLCRPEFLQG